MHSLGIVQWNSTRRDHPGNPGEVSELGPIIAPMVRLTWKEVKFEWNDFCEKALQELKRRLTSAPILIVPKQG